MLKLSPRSYVVIGTLILILLIGWTVSYVVFLSPTGIVAREEADLTRVDADADTFSTLDGTPVDIDAYRSKVLVVNIWASWSPYTAADHDILSQIASMHGDAVTILAVNRMETKETADVYLRTIGKRPGIEYIIDSEDRFFGSFEGYAMPETIVFDEVGNIALHQRGPVNQAELETLLRALVSD